STQGRVYLAYDSCMSQPAPTLPSAAGGGGQAPQVVREPFTGPSQVESKIKARQQGGLKYESTVRFRMDLGTRYAGHRVSGRRLRIHRGSRDGGRHDHDQYDGCWKGRQRRLLLRPLWLRLLSLLRLSVVPADRVRAVRPVPARHGLETRLLGRWPLRRRLLASALARARRPDGARRADHATRRWGA